MANINCPKCKKPMKPSKTERLLLECAECDVRVATQGYKPPPKE